MHWCPLLYSIVGERPNRNKRTKMAKMCLKEIRNQKGFLSSCGGVMGAAMHDRCTVESTSKSLHTDLDQRLICLWNYCFQEIRLDMAKQKKMSAAQG